MATRALFLVALAALGCNGNVVETVAVAQCPGPTQQPGRALPTFESGFGRLVSATDGTSVTLAYVDDGVLERTTFDGWGPWSDQPLDPPEPLAEDVFGGTIIAASPDERFGALIRSEHVGPYALVEATVDGGPELTPLAESVQPSLLGPRQPDGSRLVSYGGDTSAMIAWLVEGELLAPAALGCGGARLVVPAEHGYLLATLSSRALGSCSAGQMDRLIEVIHVGFDGQRSLRHVVPRPLDYHFLHNGFTLLEFAPRPDGFVLVWRNESNCFDVCGGDDIAIQELDRAGRARGAPIVIEGHIIAAEAVGERLALVRLVDAQLELSLRDRGRNTTHSFVLEPLPSYEHYHGVLLAAAPDAASLLVATVYGDGSGRLSRVDCLAAD